MLKDYVCERSLAADRDKTLPLLRSRNKTETKTKDPQAAGSFCSSFLVNLVLSDNAEADDSAERSGKALYR